MASIISVEKLQGLSSGDNPNTIIVPAGQTLDASAGGFTTPAGHVIQVVQTVKTDTQSSTSNSDVDITGLSATITPSSTSSKILVCVDVQGSGWEGDSTIQLYDNSTGSYAITVKGDANSGPSALFGLWTQNAETDHRWAIKELSAKYLHSPATTNPITYKLTFNSGGAQTVYINRGYYYNSAGSPPGTISTITLMEIAG